MLMWLATFFVFLGSIITFIAAWGVLRLPDFFMRMHAATKAGVVGPSLLLVGVGFFEPSWSTWIKIALAVLFLLITTPIAGHVLGKAGFIGGVALWSKTTRNDLESVLPAREFVETDRLDPLEQSTGYMLAGSHRVEQGTGEMASRLMEPRA